MSDSQKIEKFRMAVGAAAELGLIVLRDVLNAGGTLVEATMVTTAFMQAMMRPENTDESEGDNT